MNINGELKKKRGRPRTLDGPEDDDNSNLFSPRISLVQGGVNGLHSSSGLVARVSTHCHFPFVHGMVFALNLSNLRGRGLNS